MNSSSLRLTVMEETELMQPRCSAFQFGACATNVCSAGNSSAAGRREDMRRSELIEQSIGTNRMFGLVTSSQIASASAASF